MPTKPKTAHSTTSQAAELAPPVKAIATEQTAVPQPAIASGSRRLPPKTRSESTPKTTRPAMPPAWASAR